MRADLGDLTTARRATLRGAAILAAATAILLPILLAMRGPAVIALVVVWVLGLAAACARYICLSCESASLTMELKADTLRLSQTTIMSADGPSPPNGAGTPTLVRVEQEPHVTEGGSDREDSRRRGLALDGQVIDR